MQKLTLLSSIYALSNQSLTCADHKSYKSYKVWATDLLGTDNEALKEFVEKFEDSDSANVDGESEN